MNAKHRIKQLEKVYSKGEKKKYFCCILDTEDKPKKEYKVQPCPVEFGGTGGDPFYLKTRKELDEFGARPDVDLEILELRILTASEAEEEANE